MPDDPSLDLDADPSVQPQEVAAALARRFEMSLTEFVEVAGGGWQPVHGVALDADFSVRWYGSGEPLQVLLGLRGGLVLVGAPEETLPGLAGPGGLRALNVVSIETSDPEFCEALRDAVVSTVERARRDLAWCHGCRTMTHAHPVSGHEGLYCVACQEHYLLIIGC